MEIYLRFLALLCSLFRAEQDHLTNRIRRLWRFNVFFKHRYFIGRCGNQASGTPPGVSLYAKKYTTRYTPHCFMLVVVLSMCLCAQGQVRPCDVPDPVGNSAAIRPLSIGEALPEALWNLPLQVVNHPEGKDAITLNDYRDKLIILDFWASWCVPCISSLSKLDSLQQQFGEEVYILPVTYESSVKAESTFARHGWQLPTIVADSVLKTYFPHRSIPHQVWLRQGEVKAVTGPEYATADYISRILSGQAAGFRNKEEVAFDKDKPLFIHGNGGDGAPLLYHAVFSCRIPSRTGSQGRRNTSSGENVFYINQTAEQLFLNAYADYIGQDPKRIIWEINDSLFRRIKGLGITKRSGKPHEDAIYDDWLFNNTFCYNLFTRYPLSEIVIKETMIRDMQQHLGTYYGIRMRTAKRVLPCLVIRQQAHTKSLLESRGGERRVVFGGEEGYSGINVLFETIIPRIVNRVSATHVLIDETDYRGRIDIHLTHSITGNIAEAQQELAQYGLLLTVEHRSIEVLIISEIGNNADLI